MGANDKVEEHIHMILINNGEYIPGGTALLSDRALESHGGGEHELARTPRRSPAECGQSDQCEEQVLID